MSEGFWMVTIVGVVASIIAVCVTFCHWLDCKYKRPIVHECAYPRPPRDSDSCGADL